MARKSASDSIQGKVDSANAEEHVYDVPEGFEDLNTVEQRYWEEYVTAKTSWKRSELVQLHRLCQLSARLEDLDEECNDTNRITVGAQGGPIEHPIFKAQRDHEKSIESKLRLLGLNVPHNVASKNANDGQKAAPGKRGKRTPKIKLVG